eukprot:TRINITY_DN9258_c5_g1_i1.p2 TRINITY_DN9258_c5_g1~~TRINITY_DN9258_c5_g1_i1.p2  ORF type:complete len:307 (+),score=109.89 TRINITY_DN9258_c5_g1_i1:104-1024(+)
MPVSPHSLPPPGAKPQLQHPAAGGVSRRALAFVLAAAAVAGTLWPFTSRGARSDAAALSLLGRDVAELRKELGEVLQRVDSQPAAAAAAGAAGGVDVRAVVASIGELADSIRAMRGGKDSASGPLPAISGEIRPATRAELGRQLQHEGKHRAAEVGVALGAHAAQLLRHWTICQSYYQVEAGNASGPLPPAVPEDWDAEKRKRWQGKLHRLRRAEALASIPDASLDFVAVAAWGTREETLEAVRDWWPKLRPGALLAVTDEALRAQQGRTRDADSVRGAVSQLAREVTRQEQELREGAATTWVLRR